MTSTSSLPSSSKPIVWTIAGSDSGGGAGIQTDLLTINDLNCHACTIITAITAQSSVAVNAVEPVSDEMFLSQLDTLLQDMPPSAIKIGLLASQRQVALLARWLSIDLHDYKKRNTTEIPVILDPVMVASCGDRLDDSQANIDFSALAGLITLVTPNSAELRELASQELSTMEAFHHAAHALSTALNCNVLAKGGDKGTLWRADSAEDLFVCTHAPGSSVLHQGRSFLLTSPRVMSENTHGTGCTLSSAIACVMASGFVLHDAIVVAKAYVSSGIKQSYQVGKGPGPVAKTSWPKVLGDFPKISSYDDGPSLDKDLVFKSIDERLGLYPVVSDLSMLETLLRAGAKTIQLRIKDSNAPALESKIANAVALGRDHQVRLFINDHWELALKYNAYGIHLGQEDLYEADLTKIAQSQMALGVSSHSYFELLLASQISPSYIALGHIFPTTTKLMPSAPQGLSKLSHYVDLFKGHYPLVAIGGIDLSRVQTVKKTGVDDIAIVRAVTEADDPAAAFQALAKAWEDVDVTV